MLENLKEQVCAANRELSARGVFIYTWGNVSGLSEDGMFVVIKPSGLDYAVMRPQDMVVVDLKSGAAVEGAWKPSSDTPTHLELYRRFPQIKGIAHTHSVHAVAFAQAGMDIQPLGTTHADDFYGPVPCTRTLTEAETKGDYEAATGRVIVETIVERGHDPMDVPAILVKNHGPFAWGASPAEAAFNAVVLETVAEMCFKTLLLNRKSTMEEYILQKHYQRKHGPDAYYGQNPGEPERMTCEEEPS